MNNIKKISDFIARATGGQHYQSYKYCFESVDIPKLKYEDKKDIQIRKKGETDKALNKPKSIEIRAKSISKDSKPLFRFFLDGSRKTYKVSDIAYDKKLYPIIAGQIGVAVCERENKDLFKPIKFVNPLVISLPDDAYADSIGKKDLFFNNLTSKLNKKLQLRNLTFDKIIPYATSQTKETDKYEDKGIAQIQNEMVDKEQEVVLNLVRDKRLNSESFLIKDGSLEYMKGGSDYKELSKIKANYDCVVGVSKMFNPEALSNNTKEISRTIAELKLYERTPAFMYNTERIPGVKFAVWYLRIRDTKYSSSPFDGVLKLEKILVREEQEENGLDSDEIDNISANVINERNPVCYGKDDRWAKHLYPVYLTESYIKSRYLSDVHFMNLF